MTRIGSPADLAASDGTSQSILTTGERRGLFSRLLTAAALGSIGLIVAFSYEELGSELQQNWSQLLYWSLLILLVNFLYVDLKPIQFTLDLPLLIAIGLLYPAPTAALVALVGSADVREFRGRIGMSRAVFNRSQIALSVFGASTAYHAVASSLDLWPAALLGTSLATAIFTGLNGLLVSAHVASRGEGAFHRVLLGLHVGRSVEFLVTYFAYGVLAYALARLYVEAGSWSVPLFLVPIVVAHVAFVRAERLSILATNVKRRERLLELLMNRIVDERRDERLRIASGLHDDVLQSLIRMSQLGFFLRQEIEVGSQAAQDAVELEHLSDETIRVLREVVGDLQHSPVGRGGLVQSLQSLSEDLQFESRVKIQLDAEPDLDLPVDRQLLLYQVAKEAVTNALAHAEPEHIRIGLSRGGIGWALTIEDDGKGFDPSGIDESKHFGLALMRERLRLMDGVLVVKSRPGSTCIEARLPSSTRNSTRARLQQNKQT